MSAPRYKLFSNEFSKQLRNSSISPVLSSISPLRTQLYNAVVKESFQLLFLFNSLFCNSLSLQRPACFLIFLGKFETPVEGTELLLKVSAYLYIYMAVLSKTQESCMQKCAENFINCNIAFVFVIFAK